MKKRFSHHINRTGTFSTVHDKSTLGIAYLHALIAKILHDKEEKGGGITTRGHRRA